MMQDQEFPVENWGTGLESLRSSGLGVLSALESAVYNMVEPMWVSKENLKNIFMGHHRTLPDIILEYEQMADAEVRRLAAKAEDKTAFYNARCHSDAWIAAASATAAEKGASGVAGNVKTLAQDQHRLLQAEEARQEAGSEGINESTKTLTNPNQMQQQVKKGKAPKGVSRVDPSNPDIPNSQPYIHFGENESALNLDGTWHDAGNSHPSITNKGVGIG